MILLFYSKGCGACDKILENIPEVLNQKIQLLELRFEDGQFLAYTPEGEKVGGEAPQMNVPSLLDLATEEVFFGYTEIMKRFNNE